MKLVKLISVFAILFTASGLATGKNPLGIWLLTIGIFLFVCAYLASQPYEK